MYKDLLHESICLMALEDSDAGRRCNFWHHLSGDNGMRLFCLNPPGSTIHGHGPNSLTVTINR